MWAGVGCCVDFWYIIWVRFGVLVVLLWSGYFLDFPVHQYSFSQLSSWVLYFVVLLGFNKRYGYFQVYNFFSFFVKLEVGYLIFCRGWLTGCSCDARD